MEPASGLLIGTALITLGLVGRGKHRSRRVPGVRKPPAIAVGKKISLCRLANSGAGAVRPLFCGMARTGGTDS